MPAFAGMKTGASVLDVCCGTGDQVAYYARAGLKASGIDSDARMIAIARRRRIKTEHEPVFCRADAGHLPFKDGTFDFVSACLALHEKPVWLQQRLIQEAARVAGRSGCLVLADYAVPMPQSRTARLIATIEYMAGRKHFACFQDYMQRGGLEAIIGMADLHEFKRGSALGGSVSLLLAKLE